MKETHNIDAQIKQLLDMLQRGMNQKNMNTAALASEIGLDRKILKRLLTGSSDISVRDFMRISMALNLDASFLEEQNMLPSEEAQSATPSLTLQEAIEEKEDGWEPLPFGNHTRQLIAYGFALGCNMLLLCRTEKLKQSNVPEQVRAQFHPHMPIQLDAQYHPYNKPQYFDDGLELRLSFDALYTCFFPWHSIERVIFLPQIEEEPSSEEEQPTTPTLRLV